MKNLHGLLEKKTCTDFTSVGIVIDYKFTMITKKFFSLKSAIKIVPYNSVKFFERTYS